MILLIMRFQQYLDADDPENGIEDEYHPKNDQYVSHLSNCNLSLTPLQIVLLAHATSACRTEFGCLQGHGRRQLGQGTMN